MATRKKSSLLNQAIIDEMMRFMEYHPATRLNKNLRRLLIEFLQFDGATEARYLNDLLYDLEGLFALLDVIEALDENRGIVAASKL